MLRDLYPRWRAAAYAGLFVGIVVATWAATTWPVSARITITEASGLTVFWFQAWRVTERRRRAAEAEKDSQAEAERRRALMRDRSWMN